MSLFDSMEDYEDYKKAKDKISRTSEVHKLGRMKDKYGKKDDDKEEKTSTRIKEDNFISGIIKALDEHISRKKKDGTLKEID